MQSARSSSSPRKKGTAISRPPLTQNEMLNSVAENLITEAMQEVIMSDILVEIISKNQVS